MQSSLNKGGINMSIRKGIFKVRNTATGEKDEVMLKTTIEQVDDLDKLTGATANAPGVWGLAPAPAKGSQSLPLCGDATYKVLPVEGGGTGANTVAAAVKALLGSSAVGSSTKSIYYDGATLKACADSIGGGGIVAALLEQNGYVKFANGLILQWGNAGSNNGSVDVTFPISFTKAVYQIQLTYNNSSYENPTYEIKDTKSFSYWSKYGGDKLWLAIGVQQWGYNNTDYAASVTFPIAFTKSCYAIAIGPHNRVTGNVVAQNITNSKFSLTAPESGDCAQARWIAIGVQRSGEWLLLAVVVLAQADLRIRYR